jgi:hypothetical protein
MSAAAVAARLKLKRKAGAEDAGVAAPPSSSAADEEPDISGPRFCRGQSVMGNFKGFGDWDEALIVGLSPDGTYVLEYVDEGLIEEGVPEERIMETGADAEASAALASGGGVELEAALRERAVGMEEEGEEEEGGEEESSEESSDEEGSGVLASDEPFVKSRAWLGRKEGYVFKAGEQGVGYYRDVPLHEAEEAEERARLVLTAPQLANWSVEVLSMPPSVKKVDRYMSLFSLPGLSVTTMGTSKASSATLFSSLEDWFEAQLPLLATRVAPTEVEVTLRVFLAPQQSIRQGLQHVTFSVDWARVAGSCEAEPLSGAMLRQMGLE